MKYVFSGMVHPERADFGISPSLPLQSIHKETGLDFSTTLSVNASQLTAEVIINKGNSDLYTLKNIVQASIAAIVDVYGYVTGRGYDVEIVSVVDENGNKTVFGVGIPVLESSQSNRPFDFDGILKRNLTKSEFLVYALADLRDSIRSTYSGYYCYRALECIRQYFYKPEEGEDRTKSWIRMRQALNFERVWIDEVQGYGESQ